MVSELKNYTTRIPAEKSVAEIERMLAQHGATDILKNYDREGNLVALNFAVQISPMQKVGYRLPLDVQKLHRVILKLRNEGRLKHLTKRQAENIETARRIGWRLLRDWLHAQIAFIKCEQVTLDQIFLPYAYDTSTGKTFYELIKDRDYRLLEEESQ